jgi:hypothetical protein
MVADRSSFALKLGHVFVLLSRLLPSACAVSARCASRLVLAFATASFQASLVASSAALLGHRGCGGVPLVLVVSASCSLSKNFVLPASGKSGIHASAFSPLA